MAELRLALVGCGGMGLRHMYGLIELKEQGFDTFDIAALCDLHPSAAERVAQEAETGLGRRPRTYTSFDEMLEKQPGLDAVDVVTDTRFHHVFALKALDAGKHVAVEKPMGLTVRACRRMIEGARRTGRVLSVSENYRRDPMNRLVKALLEAQVLGEPRLVFYVSLRGGRTVQQVAAWRHMKLRGGYLLEYGVHDADLLLYFMGNVDTLYAHTHLWEKVRHMSDQPQVGHLAQFYSHRVQEDTDKQEAVECTAEDTALALLRFDSQATGFYAMSGAALGEPIGGSVIYGSGGSVKLPGSRSGRPVEITRPGASQPLSPTEVLALVPQFGLDDVTARFFGGEHRLPQYHMPFPQIDRKLIAVELQDFADAILQGHQPEVTGEVGLRAVALCYGVLESGYLRKPVPFADVVEDGVNAYQREINENAGL